MNRYTKMIVIGISLVTVTLAACGEVTRVGNPDSDKASLTRLADLPELDISRYDTSSSNYTSLAAFTTKAAVSSSGRFSRDGCDAKSIKQEMVGLSLFAEEFLCLYKMGEEHYSTQFSVPTDEFAYYTIETEEDTLLARIGHFTEGFGAISEAVLVIDECNAGTHVAEMRVTADTVNAELTGSGYYIRFAETDYLGEDTEDEALAFTIDTRESVWDFSVDFYHPLDGSERVYYGNLSLGLDTVGEFNLFTSATYDEDLEGTYEIAANTVFGPWTELEGFTIGGSSHVNVIQSADPESVVTGQITGFVFNDSPDLPAIQLDATEEAEFPFHAELAALADPVLEVSEPVIALSDEWDCTVPQGEEAITIDLTPADIEAELIACEGGEDDDEVELNCAAIEDAQDAQD